MPINITMPALSPTMEEGNLAKWLKKEGDPIKSGDVIAEIETDKATMEVEAVDEGTLAKILVPAGAEGVKVNTVIAVLAAEGEDIATAAKGSGDGANAAPKSPERAEQKAPSPHPEPVEGRGEGVGKSAAAPALRQAQGEGGVSTAPASAQKGDARIFSSPLARRLAKDAGIELAAINGSGPHGRIVQRDVEAAIASGTGKTRAAEAPKPAAPVPMSDDKILKLFEEGAYELKPHDNMRKVIARRLIEAKTTIPHFYLTIDCDLDALLALRQQLNDAAPVKKSDKGEEPAYKLSVNDMVIKALAMALQAVPEANASWTEANMVMHRHSDVGVAVSIPGGLITPIIRHAEQKSLSAISNEMKDMAKRARERKLKPEEYQGGSTAVSNLGMFGIKDFAAVINPPHATILAVGAGEQRAVVRNGAVKIATVMSVTLSTDHRAVDGALGAQLLDAFKRYIEKPMGMLV